MYRRIMRQAMVAFGFMHLSYGAAIAGETYFGTWGNSATTVAIKTSIKFISKNPLKIRYCFRSSCSNHVASGTENKMVLIFPKNRAFPGARLSLTKKGKTYLGRYRRKGKQQVSRATYKKR